MRSASLARPSAGLRRGRRGRGRHCSSPSRPSILFAGVVSRYVLHAPLTWSDELASILFLWLAMLGAVVAYARGRAHAHERARRGKNAAPRRRSRRRCRSRPASSSCVLVLPPAIEYAIDEATIVTPRRSRSRTSGAPPPCRSASA